MGTYANTRSFNNGCPHLLQGIEHTHAAIANLVLAALHKDLSAASPPVVAAHADSAASSAMLETWSALLTGGALALMPPGATLGQLLGSAGVTTALLTGEQLESLLEVSTPYHPSLHYSALDLQALGAHRKRQAAGISRARFIKRHASWQLGACARDSQIWRSYLQDGSLEEAPALQTLLLRKEDVEDHEMLEAVSAVAPHVKLCIGSGPQEAMPFAIMCTVSGDTVDAELLGKPVANTRVRRRPLHIPEASDLHAVPSELGAWQEEALNHTEQSGVATDVISSSCSCRESSQAS